MIPIQISTDSGDIGEFTSGIALNDTEPNYPIIASTSCELDNLLNLLLEQAASITNSPPHQRAVADADNNIEAWPDSAVADHTGHPKERVNEGLNQIIGFHHTHHEELQMPLKKRTLVGPTLEEIESALRRIPCDATAESLCPSSAASHSKLTPDCTAEGPAHWPSTSVSPTLQPPYYHAATQGFLSINEDDTLRRAWRSRRPWTSANLQPRYKVRIKSNNDYVVNSDGYKWHKYGQKSIKSTPYPRSYYKCSTGKCQMKKQVERCTADMLLVTYEGLHIHYRP